MSELARNEYNDDRTAFSLRDEFLRLGTIYTQFNCTFCDVELFTVAVSPELTYVRAPHYRVADDDIPHATDCPYGAGGLVNHGIVLAPAKKHKYALELPERLVPVRAAQAAGTPTQNKPSGLASPTEIRRRVIAGISVLRVPNQYTTSLLKTLSDARRVAMKKLYNVPSIGALPNPRDQSKKVFQVLSTYPLDLYGRTLNYDSAFHTTKSEPWRGEFIYYGTASVQAVATGFLLTSVDLVLEKRTGAVKPAHIYINCNTAAPVNRMEGRTINTLNTASTNGISLKWYAYGALTLNASGNEYELHVNSPEHISV